MEAPAARDDGLAVPRPGRIATVWARLPEGVRAALAIYATFRLPVEVLLMLSRGALPPGPGALGMPRLDGPALLHTWLRWDSGWYLQIAREGFSYSPCVSPGDVCRQASVAFLPGFPMLVRAFAGLGLPVSVASFAVTHLSLLLALWGLHRLASRFFDGAGARRAMAAMVLFPTSLFLSVGYPEVMFLAAGIWAVVFFEENRPIPTALCLCLGLLIRSQGMLLVPAVVLAALARRRWSVALVSGVATTLVLCGYLYWQQQSFGDPLAFVHARKAWGMNQTWMELVTSYWHRTVAGEVGLEGWLDFATLPWLVVCSVLSWKRFGAAHGLFLAAIAATALLTGQVWALSRLGLCGFGVFLLLARWTERPALARVLAVVGLAAITIGGVRFSSGYFTGS